MHSCLDIIIKHCITEFIKFDFFVVCTTYHGAYFPNSDGKFFYKHALTQTNNQHHSESKECTRKYSYALFVFKIPNILIANSFCCEF